MKKLKHFLQKLVFSFLLLFFFCSVCFSETVFKIKETELNRILQETETLKEIVNEQSTQLQQYQKLSDELRNEAESQKKKTQFYKNVAIGACASSVLLGGSLWIISKK